MKSFLTIKKFKLLELIRNSGKEYLKKHSMISREVIAKPGGWRCLDLIYGNDPDCLDGAGSFKPKGFIDRMFFYSTAAEATRNRLREFEKVLRRLIKNYRTKALNILSIASGPGRDILNLVEEFGNIKVRATCIDIDREAIILGKRLAKAKGLSGRIIYKNGNAKRIDEYEEENKYHIIITQGYLDYLSYESSVEFLKKVHKIIMPGGSVIISNMSRHKWMKFWMEFFGGWNLDYKNEDMVRNILKDCGYVNVEVFTESRELHFIGVGEKT
jgi:2-polyprenyl-3-methyl-5-hydroxy-6-metoxy-1,4-benzoquinol methylase